MPAVMPDTVKSDSNKLVVFVTTPPAASTGIPTVAEVNAAIFASLYIVGDFAVTPTQNTGKTFYILDEPTTGLHFQDIQHLLDVLNKLVDRGNTVLVIEHNLDVVKVADHIIDLGPEGGDGGGTILFEGVPEKMVNLTKSHTARFLKTELK